MNLAAEVPMDLLYALLGSSAQDGCTDDLIVVSSVDLANVLRAAGIEFSFSTPDDDVDEGEAYCNAALTDGDR